MTESHVFPHLDAYCCLQSFLPRWWTRTFPVNRFRPRYKTKLTFELWLEVFCLSIIFQISGPEPSIDRSFFHIALWNFYLFTFSPRGYWMGAISAWDGLFPVRTFLSLNLIKKEKKPKRNKTTKITITVHTSSSHVSASFRKRYHSDCRGGGGRGKIGG